MSLARNQQDPALLLEAHFALGMVSTVRGEFALAREHFKETAVLYNPQQHRSHVLLYGQDPQVGCLSYTAHVLWFLGYPDQALKKSQETLSLVQNLSHPNSYAWALSFGAAWFHYYLREGQATQEYAEAAITLCHEQEFPIFLAQGTILRGWALAEQGHGKEGLAEIHQGLATWRATGAADVTFYFTVLAEAYEKVGQTHEGLSTLTEALTMACKTEERMYEAELYRLRGELTLAQSSIQRLESSVQKEAEECFLKAIDIARQQQAKSWELRASTSLSRFWQQQGKQKEAHALLSAVYSWFTEGFDTKDLQEAKALLDELAREQ